MRQPSAASEALGLSPLVSQSNLSHAVPHSNDPADQEQHRNYGSNRERYCDSRGHCLPPRHPVLAYRDKQKNSAGEVPRPPEAIHIPILLDANIYPLRGLLDKIEIDRAIKALTSS